MLKGFYLVYEKHSGVLETECLTVTFIIQVHVFMSDLAVSVSYASHERGSSEMHTLLSVGTESTWHDLNSKKLQLLYHTII
jgi:hypothetical protein